MDIEVASSGLASFSCPKFEPRKATIENPKEISGYFGKSLFSDIVGIAWDGFAVRDELEGKFHVIFPYGSTCCAKMLKYFHEIFSILTSIAEVGNIMWLDCY